MDYREAGVDIDRYGPTRQSYGKTFSLHCLDPFGVRLELCAGARFDLATVAATDVLVRRDASLDVRDRLACRNLEVEGRLKATVVTNGRVTVRPGGVGATWLKSTCVPKDPSPSS